MISIVQCPGCGWIQASTASKSFKCRRCNKTRELRKVKVIKVVDNARIAQALIATLREKY